VKPGAAAAAAFGELHLCRCSLTDIDLSQFCGVQLGVVMQQLPTPRKEDSASMCGKNPAPAHGNNSVCAPVQRQASSWTYCNNSVCTLPALRTFTMKPQRWESDPEVLSQGMGAPPRGCTTPLLSQHHLLLSAPHILTMPADHVLGASQPALPTQQMA
jgi:hypothetical protein